MKHEEKDLLLKDLCCRLPYKVKAQMPDEYGGYTSAIESIDIDGFVADFEGTQIEIECIKPYLFPLSNMTEEQEKEWRYTLSSDGNITYDTVDWCNKNHFDYRGLIPMDLAIDATGLNIYKEE